MIAALRPLAIALATALLLSSCNDEPRPRFEEPTETPSPSESTSSAAAEKEPWEVKSKAGAVAFAKHWIVVFNDALASGDTTALKSATSPECESCQGYIDQLDRLYGNGGHLESEGWTLIEVGSPPGAAGSSIELPMRINRTAQKVVSGDGGVQRFPGGGKETFLAEVRWVRDQWVMQSLDVLT